MIEAGPMVLIFTALVAIFTIGLDDNENNRTGDKIFDVECYMVRATEPRRAAPASSNHISDKSKTSLRRTTN